MASSYSTDLKLELMVTGENAGTWGDKTNTNLNLIQQAIAGVESIALSDGGDVTLVMTDAAISNARNMVLKLTGTLTGASTLSIPDTIEKFYIIDATSVTGPTNLTVKTVSGTGFTLDQAKIYACYTNGTDVVEISLDTLGGTVAAANITGTISTAQIADNAVTTAKISDNQITTAKISDNQITTAKISDNQVTADKLDDVLTDSGGTAGAYTTADITVDAQGRITAVASGVAGGAEGLFIAQGTNGPASGTYTSAPGATAVQAFIIGGGGGAGGSGGGSPPQTGGPGGYGGYGIYTANVTGGAGLSYAVGAGGTGGAGGNTNGSAGSAGGNTNLTNVGTANGGSGGSGGVDNAGGTAPQGAAGSAPGSIVDFSSNTTNANRVHAAPELGAGGTGNPGERNPGNNGIPGYLTIFESKSI